MGDIVNLKRARKQRDRDSAEKQAAENRVRHGRTRHERECAAAEAKRLKAVLDGKNAT